MKATVTGCAGFIGSTLTDALLELGTRVRGIDCFTSYYDPKTKRANLGAALTNPNFELVEADLRTCDVGELIEDVDVVYHQAGQPGVRLSWADGFGEYEGHNVLATQRLLEAARNVDAQRVVFASSSSVYGRASRYPTSEADLPEPHSPYGVTKLAAEHLCSLYASNWGLSTVSLRYFSVYGPRQRPDMAVHRMIEAGISNVNFPMYGDGSAIRDMTFVGDVVRANLAAGSADLPPGTVLNVAGGGEIRVADLMSLIEDAIGCQIPIEKLPSQPGDVERTGGAVDRAVDLLSWTPTVDIRDGLARQVEWHRRAGPSVVAGGAEP